MVTKGSEVNVVIPFVRIEASQNPNQRARRRGDPATPYFQAMLVSFASLRRFNEKAQLTLVTNASPPSPFAEQLSKLGVQICIIPFAHRPPPGFSDRFTASLYLLDALEQLTAEITVLIDPDILCIRPLDSMLSRSNGSVGVLQVDSTPDEDINGLTRRKSGELHALLGEPLDCPIHYGGEFYLIPIRHLKTLQARCMSAWALALERHALGRSKFWTEEHILSFALRGVPVTELGDFIRRIWTAHSFRQVDGNERDLTLWHLPAEKDRGFASIYLAATDRESWFWTLSDDAFRDHAGQAMGLHKRNFTRLALGIAGHAVRRARTRKSNVSVELG